MANSSESDEPSANKNNYKSTKNNKIRNHIADVVVEENNKSLTISLIESNIEA